MSPGKKAQRREARTRAAVERDQAAGPRRARPLPTRPAVTLILGALALGAGHPPAPDYHHDLEADDLEPEPRRDGDEPPR